MGGTDQKFNLLVGRHLQQIYGQTPQTIITLPLLEGLDGIKKMSKSADNYIALNDSPDDMFGKVMSLSDDLMWTYFDLISALRLDQIKDLKKRVKGGENPRDIKFILAEEIVTRFHNNSAANKAKNSFLQRFQKGQAPDEIKTVSINYKDTLLDNGKVNVARLLLLAELVTSLSEGHRALKAGSIRLEGEKIENPELEIQTKEKFVLSFGKRRFIKVKFI